MKEINKGRVEGMVTGRAEGKIENLMNNLKSLMSKHHSFEESCELLDVDEKTKEELLDTGELSK